LHAVAALNYHHLRYFWAVARHGSLARASAELHLTPQTVSTQIRELEASLDEELFERLGRRMVLTEVGQLVYGYADEIFSAGQELIDTLRGRPTGRPIRLAVGIVDVLPKQIAHRLLEPALELGEPVRIICREARAEALLAQLALHELDVILSDAPVPPGVQVRAFGHLLGECGVKLMASSKLAAKYRKDFPRSLNGAPFLLPTENTNLRRGLERWFATRDISPNIVGEFEDAALLKAFGQAGAGIFPAPSVEEGDVRLRYRAQSIGEAEGLVERFYAISAERRIQHPAVAAICSSARTDLFRAD
jgi:LysR family transcriptional activator of nhaA